MCGNAQNFVSIDVIIHHEFSLPSNFIKTHKYISSYTSVSVGVAMLANIDDYIFPEAFGSEALSDLNDQSNANLVHLNLDSKLLAATLNSVGDAVIVTDSSERSDWSPRGEQESAQAALRASEELFRATFENTAVGMAHVARDGRLLHINQQFGRMVGYSVAELLFDKYQKITHPDDLVENLTGYERMLANEIDSFSMEKRYIRKDKSILWANLEVGCSRDANHEIDYYIAVVEDITVRKQAVEDSRRFFSLSMEKRDRRKD